MTVMGIKGNTSRPRSLANKALFVLASTGFFFLVSSYLEWHFLVQENSSRKVESKAMRRTNILQMADVFTNDPVTPPFFPLPPGIKPVSETYSASRFAASPKRNVAGTFLTKVMSSSILNAIHQIECNLEWKCGEHTFDDTIFPYFKEHVDDFTRIIFLRDPFERALSAYTNSWKNKYISLKGFCANYNYCTFDEWAAEIANHPGVHLKNAHLATQTQRAQFDKMHYHYVFRVSSEIDQNFFWHKLMRQDPREDNGSKNSTLTDPTQKTIATIQRYIKNETETFRNLAKAYHEDVLLWESVLKRGTPRTAMEYTFYDYYKDVILANSNPTN